MSKGNAVAKVVDRLPIVDQRTQKQIIEQLQKMAASYVPEWRFSLDNPDPGSALALLFAHLLEGNIARLNQVPLKSFITFLNHFQVSFSPARPALAYLTFKLAEGTPQEVYVEKGLQIAAISPQQIEPIIFETAGPVVLTPAQITSVYALQPSRDSIVLLAEQTDGLIGEAGNGTVLFDHSGVNMQQHVLYLRHNFLFVLEQPAYIELSFFHSINEQAAEEAAHLLTDMRQLSWEYWSAGEWVPFDRVYGRQNIIRLLKLREQAIEEKEVFGQQGYWIRCRMLDRYKKGQQQIALPQQSILNKVQFERMLVKSEYASATAQSGLWADKMYYNDLPLIDENGYFPFGQYFAAHSMFYIASKEAFCKLGAKITVQFEMELVPFRLVPEHPRPIQWKPIMRRDVVDATEIPDMVTIAELQWEYWNGRAWVILQVAAEAKTIFKEVWEGQTIGEVTFDCPADMSEMIVNAEQNYWIRARILQVANAYSANAVYCAPQLQHLRIRYGYEMPLHHPQQLFMYNNLELLERTNEVSSGGSVIRPFVSLDSKEPALMFAFDQPPIKGPIHLYAEVVAPKILDQHIPHMEWQYLRQQAGHQVWTTLPVADETNGFTQTGVIQFVGPTDFAEATYFDKRKYWLRAVNRDHRHEQLAQIASSPRLKELRINTTLAIQQMTVINEFPQRRAAEIGASEQHTYALNQTPILTEQVWVDETNQLTTAEIEQLQRNNVPLNIVTDSADQVIQVWVQYEVVEYWHHSTPFDRHYRVDRALGHLYFGDGKRGKTVAQDGTDKVKVTYTTGGGEVGNVASHTIQTMQNTVAFVERVTNYGAAAGGCDGGNLEEALKRGPKRLAHRNRAVTIEDFEWLAYEAHPNIAKVKCLPNRNILLEKEVGSVVIVVLPKSGGGAGAHFQEIKRSIELRLKEQAAAALVGNIQVLAPAVLEIAVQAIVWVRSMDDVVPAEAELLHKLEQFLDPLTGGTDGQGFDIGQRIHSSMFFALMKSCSYVVHIPQLALDAYKLESGERQEWHLDGAKSLPHSIVMSGKHRIMVEVYKKGE
ncbi:baseplate J/gp47 family protein [Paenibacillus yanchengensis]|uniref:Baseplate J/gp47 family protein n=1 Tax=Paenibacillus yanchengensis TaxID=2035833 RepID=A0ABW4YEQ9_9BACL